MTPKAEALHALGTALKMLDDPQPLDGLRRQLLRETLVYAVGAVERIAELKRARRAAKGPEGESICR